MDEQEKNRRLVFSEIVATGRTSLPPDEESFASLSERVSEILASLREHLGLQVAFVSEFVGDRRVFRFIDAEPGMDIISPGDSGLLDESYCLRVVDGRLPSLIRNAADHATAREMPVTQSLPVGAHLSVPIQLRDGAVYGTLCAFSTTPDPSLNERDVNFLRIVANFLSMQIEPAHRNSAQRVKDYWRIQSIIDSESFDIHYQPIYSLVSNRISGFEALTRFSEKLFASPDRWFAEAGRVGLQDELEVAVLSKALKDLPNVPSYAYISVNVSPETLLSEKLGEALSGKAYKRIVLEMTEHVSIADYTELKLVLDPLRERGISIAIDDAGAGYSSFRHILTLRPDFIKLDRSLVANIHDSLGRRTLASAIIQFAEVTGAKVIAEGVEKEEELEALKKLNVSNAQGFLLGRPAPLTEWTAGSWDWVGRS